MEHPQPRVSPPRSARDYPLDQIGAHIDEERQRVSRLGEIREITFGAQDGLVSTLAVVATVAGAATDNLAVLVAGLASALAGVFSMAIGEYVGSKSQAEIFAAEVDDERQEIVERPFEAQAEIAYLYIHEGMAEEDAWKAAEVLGRHPEALLSTMTAKELGIVHDDTEVAGSPLRGAVLMGASFAVGSVFPVAPFLVTEGLPALTAATVLTGLVLFGIGAVKSRWTGRSAWRSGLEIVALAAAAGIAGYLFGTVLPELLGVVTGG